MYAIITTGGKQYKVSEGDILNVELIPDAGKTLTISSVLMVGNEGDVKVGTPFVDKASVNCDVLGEIKGDKVINFKKKRRKGYERKVGHRQRYLKLKVKKISIQ